MAGKEGVKVGKKREVKITERKKLTASERIKELEDEITNTKYNKRTQHAVGLMKAKLATLKLRATARASIGKARGDERFSVRKTGDATVLLLGFPSVGKSTLLNRITNARSDVAAYSFTTLRAIPGLMEYNQSKIQIVDVPGIVTGAASGKGRGKEVLTMIRNADLILILVEAICPQNYQAILNEVYEAGIRINQEKPDVRIIKKARGGVFVSSTINLTKIDDQTIIDIAREMRLNNVDIMIKTDINTDQLIDAIRGDAVYTKALTVLTKIDMVDEERLKGLKEEIKPDIAVSAEKNIGIEELKNLIYKKMEFIRIYLKEVSKPADMKEPMIMFKGCTIKDVCSKLHKDFVNNFKYARIWGSSAKFGGQTFRRLDKEIEDKDILELHIR